MEEVKKEQMLHNAKALRSNQTEAEQRLWYHLRAHRFMGLKFKRQKPVGRYIVDFVCVERRLIIELDGGQHAEQVTYDQQRDAWLRSQGYMALRFWNNDVMQQLEGVLEQIRCAVGPFSTDTLSPSPSPTSGRGECGVPSPLTPLGETTSHSTRLQTTAAKSLVIPQVGEGNFPSPLQGEGQGEGRKQR